MPGCVEHEGLVDVAEAMNFRLGCLQPVLELLTDGVEVTKVACGAIEQRNLARLLVGRGEGLLETCITVSKLVTSSLLRLDALFADGLAARVGASTDQGRRVELFVLLVTVIVAPADSPLVSSLCGTGGRCHDRVIAMRPGNCRRVRDGSRGRLSTAAAAMTAGSRSVFSGLATLQVSLPS
jgi:hypothetical protein